MVTTIVVVTGTTEYGHTVVMVTIAITETNTIYLVQQDHYFPSPHSPYWPLLNSPSGPSPAVGVRI